MAAQYPYQHNVCCGALPTDHRDFGGALDHDWTPRREPRGSYLSDLACVESEARAQERERLLLVIETYVFEHGPIRNAAMVRSMLRRIIPDDGPMPDMQRGAP
jgi:hypothetical protein